jgi:hypothetical protein
MTTDKPNKRRPCATGEREGEPIVTRISELEKILTFPDGTVIHVTRNRPFVPADGLWLLEMVSTLAPIFEANEELKNESAA